MIITKANLSDLKDLQKLEKICFEKDAWPLLDLIGVLTLPGITRLKAAESGIMLGFVAGNLEEHRIGWISTIGVLPEYRQKGVGNSLLEACETHLTSPEIRLTVRKSNLAAIHMYQKRGYLTWETWPKYYHDGEDALVMRKLRAV